MAIRGEQTADYFRLMCECGGHIKAEYLGYDPSVPHFKATCEKCKATTTLKLIVTDWKGLPPKPFKP